MLSERQAAVLDHLRDGGWLRSNIDFVHMGKNGDEAPKRVLMLTFFSLQDRGLIQHNGVRKNGRSFWEITPAGLMEVAKWSGSRRYGSA